MISFFRVCKVRDIFMKLQMLRALVLPIMEYCGALWGPDMIASCRNNGPEIFDNPLQGIQNYFPEGFRSIEEICV
jgi:hypothetical protein